MRLRNELAGGRHVVRLREIKGGSALAGIEVLEQTAALRVDHTSGKRAPVAQRVSGGRFDLGDLGAEVNEKFCGVRT